MKISPLAGKPANPSALVDVPKLITAYYAGVPDPAEAAQRVAFGTSGHRGSSFALSFNEQHILAITQAICLYRRQQAIDGPLYLGMDTHALSVHALTTALEVLAANKVEVMLAEGDEYTPTPAISHAILTHNRGRKNGHADGIVITPSHNSAAIFYLFKNRPHWPADAAVGKTLVGSQMIHRVTAKVGRKVCEVPVGFKWFVDGLMDGSLAFVGEESAGATLLRRDGSVWTTDKDGIVLALLAAEMTARMGRDPAEIYSQLARELGSPVYDRVEAAATPEEKEILNNLSPEQVRQTDLAGEKIESILTRAPGNDAPIGGLKVIAANGWFAARPSGTENIYKIYAESFLGPDQLHPIQEEAQAIVNDAISAAPEATEKEFV